MQGSEEGRGEKTNGERSTILAAELRWWNDRCRRVDRLQSVKQVCGVFDTVVHDKLGGYQQRR